jgi:hypothetical protein
MAFKALSEHVIACNRAKLKEMKMQEAVAAYHHEQEAPEGPQKGAHTIAREFRIGKQ